MSQSIVVILVVHILLGLTIHNRGLASVLELQVGLVSMKLDLLSRPMRWGLSAEIGSKLPFSYAYFLFKHQLFRILAGPPITVS